MNSLPRRYVVNGDGHRVLVGLTPEESFEFEALDNMSALGANSELPAVESGPNTGQESRWRELYSKHDSAWRKWMADKEGGVHLNWLIRPQING